MSCVPTLLYRGGGFFEAPEFLMRLSNPSQTPQAECRLVSQIYPPSQYVRPPPGVVIGADAEFAAVLAAGSAIHNRDSQRGAACAVVCLDYGFVHGNVLYTRSAAGTRIVYETHRANDRPYVPLIDPVTSAYAHEPMSDVTVLDLLICSAGTFNYGHWLVDDLPRAHAVAVLRAEAGPRTIRIWLSNASPGMDRVREASLRQVCEGMGPIEVRFMQLDRVYDFARLYYATPTSYHPVLKSPEALAQLASPFTATRTGPGQRLFVTRRADHGRGLLNIAVVQERLEALGFIVVDPEALSFAEQAAVFASADVVVGCMGAAMTNSVFAPVGTRLLYLAPHGWPEPFYWDLAAVRQHEYNVCFGPVADGGVPPHLSSFSINQEQLDEALAHVLR